MKSILPSHPDYETYNELWNQYAVAKNPQLFLNEFDLSETEHEKLLETLEGLMEDLLEGLPVVFLKGMEKVE